MHNLRVTSAAGLEAELAEYLPHGGVLGQNFRVQLLERGVARQHRKVAHQQRANALALIIVDYDKGDLGLAGLGDDVTSTSDDDLASILVSKRDQSDVIGKVDIHEEGNLSFRETALHCEEA